MWWRGLIAGWRRRKAADLDRRVQADPRGSTAQRQDRAADRLARRAEGQRRRTEDQERELRVYLEQIEAWRRDQ